MREFSRDYLVTFPDGGKMEIKISANLINTKGKTEKVLPEFALCSRNFYLDFGKELLKENL